MFNFLSSLAYQAEIPGGFIRFIWSWLLLAEGSPLTLIINYGVRVIIFTLFLKLILSPLDIYQRVQMKKNQRITESLKPEIEKLEKQFGGNPRVLQAKKQELNKKNGVKMMAGCLPMFVTMIISIWVLMGGLNPISQYQNMVQYLHLYDAFIQAEQEEIVRIAERDNLENDRMVFYLFDENGEQITLTNGNFEGVVSVRLMGIDAFRDISITEESEQLEQAIRARNQLDAYIQREATLAGQQAAYDRYFGLGDWEDVGGVRDSFLWVQNIWAPDVFWVNPIRNTQDFMTAIGSFSDPSELGLNVDAHYFENVVIGSYDRVMGMLISSPDNTRNGLLILPILSILVMIASQILMRKLQAKSGQMPGMGGMGAMGGMFGGGAGGGMGGKMMQYLMPVMFGIFSIFFTAAFALYMIVNSMFMIVITFLASGVIKLLDKRKQKEKVTEVGAIRYGRQDPNEVFNSGKGKKK
ncbi:MAG: membrane protein insertase YidC [Firmicutes bacterium]|nr:membrane protein insertase YidC [Bacillota bacterium]